MNESEVIDFETFEKEKEIKEKEKNTIKIFLTLSDFNYILRLYLSEEKNSIIFKLEKESDLSYFYFEKFFLNDFHQKNRIFMIDCSITQILLHIKKLIFKSEIVLERKEKNNMIVIIKSELDKYELNFDLKKIILTQNQLNLKLVKQIQENKNIIELLEKQILRMNKIVQEKNDFINDLKSKKENIIKTINDINNNINNNTNNINIQNNNKEEEKNVNICYIFSFFYFRFFRTKKAEIISTPNKEENNNREIDDKRYYNNNNIKKKNKKKNKKYHHGREQNKNNYNKNLNNNKIFCFENVEIIGNKKIFKLLVVFNVIMILIILYLINSVYSIKSNLKQEKILKEELMNKLTHLNLYSEFGSNPNDLFLENDLQKGYFKEEIISKDKNNNIKDIEFITRDSKKNKMKEKDKQKNKKYYNINKHDLLEYNLKNNFEEIFNKVINEIKEWIELSLLRLILEIQKLLFDNLLILNYDFFDLDIY